MGVIAIKEEYDFSQAKKNPYSKKLMFYKVKEVQPLTPYSLLVSFDTGVKKRYNVAPLFDKWDIFKTLADVKGLFEQVKVDAGGYGISWNDDIDLSCNELWDNGETIIEI